MRDAEVVSKVDRSVVSKSSVLEGLESGNNSPEEVNVCYVCVSGVTNIAILEDGKTGSSRPSGLSDRDFLSSR